MHTLDPVSDSDLLDDPGLTCPACDADLMRDELFGSHRVCSTCGRHFSLSARERVSLLVDPESFDEMRIALVTPDVVPGHDQKPAAERLAEHHHLQVIGDAVVTGVARISGIGVTVIALDDHLVGAMLGATMTEKIILALEQAMTRKLPVVVLFSGSPGAAQSGQLAMVQGGRLSSAFAQLHLGRIPVIGILAHGVSESVFSVLATHGDVLFSEPDVAPGRLGTGRGVGISVARSRPLNLVEDGWIDEVVERSRLRGQLSHVLDLLANPGVARAGGAGAPVATTWPKTDVALQMVRHANRPPVDHYLSSVFSGLLELRGDRVTGNTDHVICGIARVESLTVAVAALREGDAAHDARAARKVVRLARLAGRLELPLVLLVGDGTAPEPGFNPEAAFAEGTLRSMLSVLPVPVISICTGVARSSLAMALLLGDRSFMLSNAVLRGGEVAGPVPANPHTRMHLRSMDGGLALTAHDCERLGLVDGVIEEPNPGAHTDPEGAAAALKVTLLQALSELTGTGQRRLLDTRLRRQRTLGQLTPDGLAAARSELWEIQEWQRSVAQSFDELRDRWDQIRASSPKVSFHRPELPDLAARFRARRDELLERARSGDRGGES
jgi:acetyl-CoA carboxylase carboxyl transferase subunit beta